LYSDKVVRIRKIKTRTHENTKKVASIREVCCDQKQKKDNLSSKTSVADPDDFLTEFGTDFWKRPDPDLDINKFLANFFLQFFSQKNVLIRIYTNQKEKQQGFLQYSSG
jgi:hypothetical protein